MEIRSLAGQLVLLARCIQQKADYFRPVHSKTKCVDNTHWTVSKQLRLNTTKTKSLCSSAEQTGEHDQSENHSIQWFSLPLTHLMVN